MSRNRRAARRKAHKTVSELAAVTAALRDELRLVAAEIRAVRETIRRLQAMRRELAALRTSADRLLTA